MLFSKIGFIFSLIPLLFLTFNMQSFFESLKHIFKFRPKITQEKKYSFLLFYSFSILVFYSTKPKPQKLALCHDLNVHTCVPLLWAWSPPPRGHHHPIRTRPGVSATQPAGDTCRHAGFGLWVPQGSGNLGGPASFISGTEPGTRRLQEGLDELIDGLTGP